MIEQEFPACILLAAGRSQRMGQDKLQIKLPSGFSLLEQTVKNLGKIPFRERILVLRSKDFLTFDAEHYSFQLLEIGAVANLGMHRSLKLGLRKLKQNPDFALIALADQPFLTPDDYLHVLNEFNERQPLGVQLLQPVQGERKGNPVVLHRNFFPEIEAEPDSDHGARYLFERHPDRALLWETANPNYFVDLDTPLDLQIARFKFDGNFL